MAMGANLTRSCKYAKRNCNEVMRLSYFIYQSSVLFEETARLIPPNAITIEIAPHGLLQAILRRSLKKDVINIPLTERKHQDNVQVLLTALGK